MGLTLGVGFLAAARNDDLADCAAFRAPYEQLNAALADAGAEPHHEPLDLPAGALFEAQMWGYGGLHRIRRLAAWHAIEGRLPEPAAIEDTAEDPLLQRFHAVHAEWTPPSRGLFARLFRRPRPRPPFRHLMLHSDCEGFYLPRAFEEVIVDASARPGLGGTIGSSVQLLAECRQLAALIELPEDIDPEAAELWDVAEMPREDGPAWHRYGVEAFGLARLIAGCERSIEHGAVLAFG